MRPRVSPASATTTPTPATTPQAPAWTARRTRRGSTVSSARRVSIGAPILPTAASTAPAPLWHPLAPATYCLARVSRGVTSASQGTLASTATSVTRATTTRTASV
ncbi:hypothetical protein RLOC_00002613 [Lonchura striata]|uniref:Uncharacterized protein n=1 Tax=Lonchura striata TaxID=40157 RepID=A0A218V197_9PASE|nr:hypothetical protein RLOC_00002613 [Lonchura striata domestica]